MTYLVILCATVAAISAQPETIIQNKNVNIIVTLDPREVAKELWKVIDARLNNRTGHFTNSKNAIRDLEKVVSPLISSTRRGATPPSVFQVASQLDQITRKTLTRDTPTMNLMDEEIMTRDIVADMMVSLKMLLTKTVQSKIDEEEDTPSRRMHRPAAKNIDERDDYVDVRIKMRREDIVNALH